MFWGKSGAPTVQIILRIRYFKRFSGVWHFGEGNKGANDATINNYDAPPAERPAADAAGVIGRCRRFDGSTKYFAMNGTAGVINFRRRTYTLPLGQPPAS